MDPKSLFSLSDHNYGTYVQPFNYPTGPKRSKRLRITPSPVHADGDIGRLIHAPSDIWLQCELRGAPSWPDDGCPVIAHRWGAAIG